MLQITKLHGLQLLRRIAKGTPGKASVAPFKVYSTHSQFRLAHAQGKPRLLVRTDEKGQHYHKLESATMPRYDIHTAEGEEKIRELLRKTEESYVDKIDPSGKLRFVGAARFIIHPTRPRHHVHTQGRLILTRLRNGKTLATLSLGYDRKDATSHHFRFADRAIEFEFRDNRLRIERDVLNPERRVYTPLKQDQKLMQLIHNLEAFISEGLKRKLLLQKGRFEADLRFVTWQDKPSAPEFYDYR